MPSGTRAGTNSHPSVSIEGQRRRISEGRNDEDKRTRSGSGVGGDGEGEGELDDGGEKTVAVAVL